MNTRKLIISASLLGASLASYGQISSIPYDLNPTIWNTSLIEDFNSMYYTPNNTPNASGLDTTWSVLGATNHEWSLTLGYRPNDPNVMFGAANQNRGYNAWYNDPADRWLGVYQTAPNQQASMTALFKNTSGTVMSGINMSYDAALLASSSTNSTPLFAGLDVYFSKDNVNWTLLPSSYSVQFTNDAVTSVNPNGWLSSSQVQVVQDLGGIYNFPTAVDNNDVFYLRWDAATQGALPGYTNSGLGIAIDNLELAAVPEPSTYGILGASLLLGLVAFFKFRQKTV